MNEKLPGTAQTTGSGASAASNGVAASHGATAVGGDQVAGDKHVHHHAADYDFEVRSYLRNKGPRANFGMGNPAKFWELVKESTITVEKLREILLSLPDSHLNVLKDKPAQLVSVSGMLYPCGLLVSGWWESRFENPGGLQKLKGVKRWLFNGFHAWGPSFDFSWDFHQPAGSIRPAFVAQLATGDEANSIPVIIPAEKARQLRADFQQQGKQIHLDVSPLAVTVDGVLCHRSQCPEAAVLGKVGGILDFCIWLKDGEKEHCISVDPNTSADIYSGYLWKCLAPKRLLDENRPLQLHEAYFLWEHTNLADEDSVKYNLDALDAKHRYLEEKYHDNEQLVVLQKSNILVRGKPYWDQDQFYEYFLNRKRI